MDDPAGAEPTGPLQRIMASWVAIFLITLCVGTVAAILKQSIASSGDGTWGWVPFCQDLVQYGFIAGVLATLTAAVKKYQDGIKEREKERQGFLKEQLKKQEEEIRTAQTQSREILGRIEVMALAVSGWNRIPPKQPAPPPLTLGYGTADLDMIQRTPATWRSLADDFESVRDMSAAPAGPTESAHRDRLEFTAGSFKTLIPRLSGEYLANGGRMRRLIWLDHLTNDLKPLESATDLQLAAAARGSRISAIQLMSWIQHTNSAIMEDLVLGVDFVPRGNSSAVGFRHDGILPLLHHMGRINHALGTPARGDPSDADWLSLDSLLRQSLWSLGALRNELRAAAKMVDNLVLLIATARIARGAPPLNGDTGPTDEPAESPRAIHGAAPAGKSLGVGNASPGWGRFDYAAERARQAGATSSDRDVDSDR